MAAVPVNTTIQTQIANLYIAILGRNPEPAGFGYWCDALANNGGTQSALNAITLGFSNSPEFVATYGGQTTNAAIGLMYTNVLSRTADTAGLNYWVGVANGYIAQGYKVAEAYALTGNAIITAAAANTGTADQTLIQSKEAAAIAAGTSAPTTTYTLTTGTDIINGTNQDDVFQGDAVVTAVLPGQTLNTSDNLNGGDGYNVLNAQLVNTYTAPAGLTNIQEINLSQTADITNVVLAQNYLPYSYNVLDLVNANATEVLGFNGFAGEVGIDILNVQTELTTINFSNIFSFGEDMDVYVENTGTTLSGDSDTLAVNLSNVSSNLNIVDSVGATVLELEQTEDSDAGYETVNIAVTGSARNETALALLDVNGTISTINVSGNATNFAIVGSGIDLDHLGTFDASAFAGNLTALFVGGQVDAETDEVADVSVTGSQGNNTLTFEETAANLTVTTFAGDDVVNVGELIVETQIGNATIDVGEGENEVNVSNLIGNTSVTGGDDGNIIVVTGGVEIEDVLGEPTATTAGDITVTTGAGDDLLTLDAVRFSSQVVNLAGAGVIVDLGTGDNTLAVGGFGGSFSFDDALISNVDTLEITSNVSASGANEYTLDISGLASSLQEIDFTGTFSSSADAIIIDGGPDALALTFAQGAVFTGGLEITNVVDLTLNVGAGVLGTTTNFDIQTGGFTATDLETLTVNLASYSTFTGPTGMSNAINALTTATVVGDDTTLFTMDFDTVQSVEISDINLSDFSGLATISVFGVGDEAFANGINITMGDGSLVYTINDDFDGLGDNPSQDEFIFTEDFVTADISGFEIGGSATADILDLSAFGITSGAGLIFTIEAVTDDLIITARTGQFDGEITLVGTFNAADAAVIAAQNIYYA